LFGTKGRRGTFIRQPVVVLDNGDWLLPIFYCQGAPGKKWVGDDDTSAVKISSDGGQTWSEYEVPNSTGCVHMNVEKTNDGRLLALFRSRWADNIYQSRSSDNGRTWSEPTPTDLPNNNSSIQFTRLDNGHLALVFNEVNRDAATDRRTSLYDEIEDPVAEEGEEEAGSAAAAEQDSTGRMAFWGVPRAPMTIAISEDNGRTWTRKRNLEIGDGYCMTNNSRDKSNREYSYPTVKQTPDGAIQIAFTYYRQAIKYVRIMEDWV
jgi:predicted neuraminidase